MTVREFYEEILINYHPDLEIKLFKGYKIMGSISVPIIHDFTKENITNVNFGSDKIEEQYLLINPPIT